MAPSSTLNCVPLVVAIVRALRPSSILDIGLGFGKYGLLLREYLEIWEMRYQRREWKIRMDCVEAHKPYITPVHHYIYNQVYVGDIFELLGVLGEYDLVLMVDVLEYFTKEKGEELLEKLKGKCRHILVVCPKSGNSYEEYKHRWTEEELRPLGAEFIRNDFGKLITLIPGSLR